ncbi:MAG: hypothetical protein KF833_18515 [Verrucomicrobiae bacterium]|nr:hypothetical protein [Verrucomicrobiae bacterium]
MSTPRMDRDPLAPTPEEVLVRAKAERLSLAELSAEIRRCELGMACAANEAARRRFEWRRDVMTREVAVRAAASDRRGEGTVHVSLTGLDPVEKELVSTLVAVLCDPALAGSRQRLREGRMALVVRDGEVEWAGSGEGRI